MIGKRIFISYKHNDMKRVQCIQSDIEHAINEKCWIDQEGIPSDAKWDSEISHAIEECDIFLFIRSKEHNAIRDFKNDWTFKEINYARKLNKTIEVISIDDSPFPDWLIPYVKSPKIIEVNNPEMMLGLCNFLSHSLKVADEKKREALPKEEFEIDGLIYAAAEDQVSVVLIGICENMRELDTIHFPSSITINGYRYAVTSIENGAFDECQSLIYIDIPASVTKIEEYAFYNCRHLNSITISERMSCISSNSLFECNALESIKVLNNPTYDSRNNCNAIIHTSTNTLIIGCKKTFIPDDVTSIEQDAFKGCTTIETVVFPKNLVSIPESTFDTCQFLTNLSVHEENPIYGSLDGGNSLLNKDTDTLIFVCHSDSISPIEIPSTIKSIRQEAFDLRHCKMISAISVDKTNSVYDSRNDCNAIIESSTNTLILGCSSTVIPESVSVIGDKAFKQGFFYSPVDYNYAEKKGLFFDDAYIPDNIIRIGDFAFMDCGSNYKFDLYLSDKVTHIGKGAFYNCDFILSLKLPESLIYIGDYAFYGCWEIDSLFIPANVAEIGDQICESKYLEKISVDVNNCNYDSRNNCNAIIETKTGTLILGCAKSKIPHGVKVIGSRAFADCCLTTITIPNSVVRVCEEAFVGCLELENIEFTGTVEQWISIDKNVSWMIDIPVEKIRCIDGDVYITEDTLS